ncbi:MAG: diguanylate cyclase [Actinomycetota bacterium]|nr:diguanylate cyclase [Actinomycetota bacterium]
MNERLYSRNLILLALLVIAGAVGIVAYAQRELAREGFAQTRTAQALLTAMLDQETGVRGLAITGEESFLAPYRQGRRDYAAAYAAASRQVAGDASAARVLAAADDVAQAWGLSAANEIRLLRAGDRRGALSKGAMRARKRHMDEFRGLNRRYLTISDRHRQALEERGLVVSVLVVAGLGALFSLAGALLTRHNRRLRAARRAREAAFDARQRDLALGLQVTESEEEAQEFLRRHLEHSIAGSEVVVLKRNNSANRLVPGTAVAEDSKLAGELDELEPRACLAVRLGQPRVRSAEATGSVLQCGICGKLETEANCSPLLVAGEVIGSVLVGHPDPLDRYGERAIEESVKQAAPVLANLRNLAIAEHRAATDGLTGLPNRRAFEESLKRMVAHANRSERPLSAVALDLDHFKQINDVHGHARGDDVLAAVGALLSSMVRASDFVARVGGEEFTLLLADTDREGALVICERARAAIAAFEFPGMHQRVTASFGVALVPDDAIDGGALVRAADRMLYLAKDNGRNRVEITDLALGPAPAGS